MTKLEREIFTSNNPLVQRIAYWFRYVDDILCLWCGSPDELQTFLTFIDSFYSSIQFTPEIGGSSINFLDLTIAIDTQNHKHHFKIFRKPTHTMPSLAVPHITPDLTETPLS